MESQDRARRDKRAQRTVWAFCRRNWLKWVFFFFSLSVHPFVPFLHAAYLNNDASTVKNVEDWCGWRCGSGTSFCPPPHTRTHECVPTLVHFHLVKNVPAVATPSSFSVSSSVDKCCWCCMESAGYSCLVFFKLTSANIWRNDWATLAYLINRRAPNR